MLLPWFQWIESLWLGKFIVGSNWMFPVIESVHLLGLALLGGSVVIVDMRLFGILFTSRPVSEIAREARPWMTRGIIVMLATGIPLFMSEAVKCYYSAAFWVKMYALAAALIYTYTIRTRVTQAEAVQSTARQVLVGALSIAVWFTVAAGGRWIGFS